MGIAYTRKNKVSLPPFYYLFSVLVRRMGWGYCCFVV